MSAALLVTALVLMLVLQVSTHLRIAGLMARLPREVENHASAKHVGDVARSLQACCDRVAEVSRALLVTADRMRVRETDLQALHAESAELLIQQRVCTAELRALAREAVVSRAPLPQPSAGPRNAGLGRCR